MSAQNLEIILRLHARFIPVGANIPPDMLLADMTSAGVSRE